MHEVIVKQAEAVRCLAEQLLEELKKSTKVHPFKGGPASLELGRAANALQRCLRVGGSRWSDLPVRGS
jgi:hypothetical protein